MIDKGVLGYNLYCEGSMIEACMDDWRKNRGKARSRKDD